MRSRKKVKEEKNSFVSGTGKHRLILGSVCSDDFFDTSSCVAEKHW